MYIIITYYINTKDIREIANSNMHIVRRDQSAMNCISSTIEPRWQQGPTAAHGGSVPWPVGEKKTWLHVYRHIIISVDGSNGLL